MVIAHAAVCRIRREVSHKTVRLQVIQNELADAQADEHRLKSDLNSARQVAACLARQEADTAHECGPFIDLIAG